MTEYAVDPQVESLIAAAIHGDVDKVRALVRAGADINGADKLGDPVLVSFLYLTDVVSDPVTLAMCRELLALGADPRRLGNEGHGTLATAMLAMNMELMRLLLDAGARPNEESWEGEHQTLYDWAEFDYRYEVWNVLPEPATEAERQDEDSWLLYLDRLAVKHGRRRPDYLFLLRERGARTMRELRDVEPAKD